MGRVGYLFHPDCLDHEMGPHHPESPERLRAISACLESTGTLSRLVTLEPRPATPEWIFKIHPRSYLQRIESQIPSHGYHSLDPDTSVSPGSMRAAYLAAGAALTAVDAIMEGQIDQAFCAVRPPGHHAEASRAMGFCLLNNVAIGARYVQEKYGLGRVLIVDWDVHHGNGTQHIFDDDSTVLYFSTHQYPHYPGTGQAHESGTGKGKGMTINVPMAVGQGDEEYQEVFQKILVPAAKSFQPEFVFISAGFDAHRDDPLASMGLTEEGYAALTKIVSDIAKLSASGRVVSCLEGGYNLSALASSVDRHILALLAG